MGTRHRAAVGITEETDAAVIVVSEETASISLVVAGQLFQELDAPRLRGALRDLLTSGRRELELPLEAEPTIVPEPPAPKPRQRKAKKDASDEAEGGKRSVISLPRNRSRRRER